jgi:hypothetical protein
MLLYLLSGFDVNCNQLTPVLTLESSFPSESGKLLTWGSADDMGQSYVTSGKHEVNIPR